MKITDRITLWFARRRVRRFLKRTGYVAPDPEANAAFSTNIVEKAEHLALINAGIAELTGDARGYLPPNNSAWLNWPQVAAVRWHRDEQGQVVHAVATMLSGTVVEFTAAQAAELMMHQPTTASMTNTPTTEPLSSSARYTGINSSLSVNSRSILAACISTVRSGLRKIRNVFMRPQPAQPAPVAQPGTQNPKL